MPNHIITLVEFGATAQPCGNLIATPARAEEIPVGNQFARIAFTPNVRAVQKSMGSRDSYAPLERGEDSNAQLGPDEISFIGARDSFYIASVSESEWPYVQHRGGPPGFLKALDSTTLGFPDYRGNRQYVSVGNLLKNDRVALILVDYPHRTRLKVLGHARIVSTDEKSVLSALVTPGYRARVERAFLITVAAFDWNCPQHITQRYTRSEMEALIEPLTSHIADLELQLKACRSQGR